MHRGLIILENGFEDVEALATIDILRRANFIIDTVSINNKDITTQSGNKIKTEYLLKDINLKDYEYLVIPGGKAVFNVLDKSSEVSNLIDYFYNHKLLICAICAAPRLLEKKGYFKDLDFTIFPNCLVDNINYTGNNTKDEVIVTSNIITARSMYYTYKFALAIIEKLESTEYSKKVEASLKGLY